MKSGEELLQIMQEAFKDPEVTEETMKELIAKAKFFEQICKLERLLHGPNLNQGEDDSDDDVAETTVRKALKNIPQISPTVATRKD